MEDYKGTGSSRHNKTDELTETVVMCTRPACVQVRWGPRTEKGNWRQAHTLTKKLFAICFTDKQKSVFSNRESLGICHLRTGLMPSNIWLTQNKLYACGHFVLFWHFFCLLPICFDLYFY